MKKIISSFLFVVVLQYASCDNNVNKPADVKKDSVSVSEEIMTDTVLAQIQLCTEYPKLGEIADIKGGKSAGAIKNLLWPSGTKVLKVHFLEGDSIVKQKVREVSGEWEKYCGIHFEYIDSGKADITISFEAGGSWSCIGKSSLKKVPSMNFGWLTASTPEIEYYRVVLHEFGHALGLIHEHQNPASNPIKWDSSTVYQYYQQAPNFWSKKDVDRNLFEKYKQESINGTAFDSSSIMLYAFPKELTKDGYFTQFNSQLSAMDKELINKLYPKNE